MANTKTTKLLLSFAMSGALLIGSERMLPAATATANLSVSATVSANCTISTAPIAFGAYDPVVTNASANDDDAGSVIVTCTRGTAATIGLALGANASGSQRRMKDAGTNYLNYEIYRDSGRTQVWGNASPNLLTPVAAPDKTARTFPVYGRIPAGQDVPAGAFTDTVVATVNF